MSPDRPHLAEIRLYPMKALDPVVVAEARVLPSGALAGDRRWALFDGTGAFVNGKRCPAVHRVRARWDLDDLAVELSADGSAPARFSLAGPLAPLERWLSRALGQPVRIGRDDAVGFPDDLAAPGPTVVSTASLEAVCGWFPGLTLEGARRRFRANLELAGVPAFWEDRLFAGPGAAVPFRIGQVRLEGTNPCQRCAVPARDPGTGAPTQGFQRIFAERRRDTLPAWADPTPFDHFYRFAVNTRLLLPPAQGARLRPGDLVQIESDS